MNGVIAFLLLGILLVLPIVTFAMVVRLCRTIGDGRVTKGEVAESWSSRLYSAAKRMALVWVSEIAFCVVVFVGLGYYDSSFLPGRYHYWLMLALPVVAFTWGVMNPRVYSDGAERVKNGRVGAWITLAILLFPMFTIVFFISRPIAPYLHRIVNPKNSEIVIRAPEWSAWKFRMVDVAPDMIPWEATDIELKYTPIEGLLPLGGSAELRCQVEKDDLLAFAKARGYEFQSVSVKRNSCANGCGDCDFVRQVWYKYNGDSSYPTDFFAYNYRYATCGGYSFFYDVNTKMLYAQWSSN